MYTQYIELDWLDSEELRRIASYIGTPLPIIIQAIAILNSRGDF